MQTFEEALTNSVSQYNTDVNFIASQALARSQAPPEDATDEERADAMAALEREARAPVGFVAASTGPQVGNIANDDAPPIVAANPDAIDVDGMDDD